MVGIERLLWDSCTFYAVLKGEEQHGANTLELLNSRIQDFNSGVLEIVVSVLIEWEVVGAGRLTDDEAREMRRLMDRSNMSWTSVTRQIARRTAELRNLTDENGSRLTPQDAVHVATAVERNCEMWTLDNGVLRLASQVKSTYGITVCRPRGQSDMMHEVGRESP